MSRNTYGFVGLEGIAALAVLSAMNGGRLLPGRDTTCRYSEPAGPPAPVSRQVRRAMMRKAAKLGRKEPTP